MLNLYILQNLALQCNNFFLIVLDYDENNAYILANKKDCTNQPENPNTTTPVHPVQATPTPTAFGARMRYHRCHVM